jgi:SAM-dependent methyltransferase
VGLDDEVAAGYDRELQRLDVVFRRACDVQTRDRVLDIGCGTGHTTRAAGLAAREGGALGVDISAPAIERARALAAAHGLGNVAFECADAQVQQFAQDRFDVAISRFGTMFFDHATAAFTNIARAVRPGGRLVMMVWQAGARNEWDVAIREALAADVSPVATPAGSAAFSLADPTATTHILAAAGFVDVAFTDVDQPVYYGPDERAALAWVRGFSCTRQLLDRLDPESSAPALDRLRQVMAAHLGDDGVWFGSRAWIVAARRGPAASAWP